MKRRITFLMCLVPSLTLGGGFQINSLSQKATAMGGSATGYLIDASAVYFNPGALGTLEKSSLTVGACLIMPRTSYLSPSNGNVDAEKNNFVPFQLYAQFKINDKMNVGFGMNSPYKFSTKWKDDWEGKYVIQDMQVSSYYLQPTFSYKINERFGVGAGIDFVIGNLRMEHAIAVSDSINPYGEIKMKANGTGFGFNIGFYGKLSDQFSFGVDYRSKAKVKLKKGTADFSNIPASLVGADDYPSGSADFESEIVFPSTFSAGLGCKVNEQLLLCFDINYTGWKTYDSLSFKFSEYPDLNEGYAKNYRSVIAVRLGGQYSVNDNFDFRAGFAYDVTPQRDGYVSPELADNNKIVLTLGAGYKFNDRLSADFSFSFESFPERKGSYNQLNFSGSYKTGVTILGLGLNYNF